MTWTAALHLFWLFSLLDLILLYPAIAIADFPIFFYVLAFIKLFWRYSCAWHFSFHVIFSYLCILGKFVLHFGGSRLVLTYSKSLLLLIRATTRWRILGLLYQSTPVVLVQWCQHPVSDIKESSCILRNTITPSMISVFYPIYACHICIFSLITLYDISSGFILPTCPVHRRLPSFSKHTTSTSLYKLLSSTLLLRLHVSPILNDWHCFSFLKNQLLLQI